MPARRGATARQPFEDRGFRRWALLRLYGDDAEFSAALEELADSFHVVRGFEQPEWSRIAALVGALRRRAGSMELPEGLDPEVAAYVDAVRATAGRFGLD